MRVRRALPAVTLATAGVLTLMAPGQAGAIESPFYAGAGYQFQDYDNKGLPDVQLGALYLTGGYNMTPWLALETSAGFGVKGDRLLGLRTELDYLFTAQVVPGWQVNDRFGAYAKLGYTQLKVDIQSIGADSDGDFGWGLGGRMRVTGNHEARLEYNRPYDDKGTTLDAWSMAYTYRF